MSSVLITGCSKGIGRAIALELAHRGHRVIATARRVETLADLPVDQGLCLDVTDDESVRDAVAQAGRIDVLVSNAGELILAPVETTPLEELTRLLEVNTLGALRVAQAVLPAMRERGGGQILFMSSIAGRTVTPLLAGYASTKWALEALAEALAVEVAHFGISVSLLQPGAVSSGALDSPPVYLTADDPYLPLAGQLAMDKIATITVEEVATAVADVIEKPMPPLRIPIGDLAKHVLSTRRVADDTQPFLLAPPAW